MRIRLLLLVASLFLSFFASKIAQSEEFTTIHEAARQGTKSTDVSRFLDSGVDVNTVGKYKATPLHQAAKNKNPEIITALIEAGANPNARAEQGGVPLLWAATENSNPRVLQLLINAGADVNGVNDYKSTPLHALVLNPHASTLAPVLITAGADVNAKNFGGLTPLHQATPLNLELTQLLINAGANVNIKDNSGRTPIFYAVGVSRFDAVKVLIEANADLTLVDAKGQNLLSYARNPKMMKLLKQNGVK